MKAQILFIAFALSITDIADAASNQHLCTTTSFEAFGEPKQTVRDCPDPDEAFWVVVTIDGLRYSPQGLGLVIPMTSHESRGDFSASLTTQVMKNAGIYRVRIEAVKNADVFNWAGDMVPGTQKMFTLSGKEVTISFARQ